MKFTFFIFFIVIVTYSSGRGQEVEHNYLVGPQLVTCDSLVLNDLPKDLSIEKIRSTKFRFDQSFKLTRKTGLQLGEYYACDNLSGFMIIQYAGTSYLYIEVKKQIWDQMISSSDPEGFFLENKNGLIEQK